MLIHWCTLQNVLNIDNRAFSMNSDLQATRKKSLSNTCVGSSDIRTITKSVCQCPDRTQQPGELVKDHTITYTEDKIQISHNIVYYFRVQPPHLKATWTQQHGGVCLYWLQWEYSDTHGRWANLSPSDISFAIFMMLLVCIGLNSTMYSSHVFSCQLHWLLALRMSMWT